jgi:hypothetical protein
MAVMHNQRYRNARYQTISYSTEAAHWGPLQSRRNPMTKLFSVFAAALMLTLSLGAFQASHAATTQYGQSTETGAYAAGGTAYAPLAGN